MKKPLKSTSVLLVKKVAPARLNLKSRPVGRTEKKAEDPGKYKSSRYLCDFCGKEIAGQKAYDIIRAHKRTDGKGYRRGFCSKLCNSKFRILEARKETECLFCKKIVISRKEDYRIFCSHKCSASFNNKKREYKKTNKELKCLDCGICFTVKQYGSPSKPRCKRCYKIYKKVLSQKNKYNQKLNNKAHYNKYKEGYKAKRDAVRLSQVLCVSCGDSMTIKKRSRVRFCSVLCYKIFLKSKTEFYQYRSLCRFNFDLKNYPCEFDFTLLIKHGTYNPKNNIDGISRDHIVSVKYGFDNKIDPILLSHPANCQLMKQRDNGKKSARCDLTIRQLVKKVIEWDKKYLTKNHVYIQ